MRERHACGAYTTVNFRKTNFNVPIKESIWEELQANGIHVTRKPELFCVFDFEVYFKELNLSVGDNTMFQKAHVPLCAGIYPATFREQPPIDDDDSDDELLTHAEQLSDNECDDALYESTHKGCKIRNNTFYVQNKSDENGVTEMVEQFYDHLCRLSDEAYQIKLEEHSSIIEHLKTNAQYYRDRIDQGDLPEDQLDSFKMHLKQAEKLKKKFHRYCRQLKCLGFNNNCYDNFLTIPEITQMLDKRKPFRITMRGRPPADGDDFDEDDDDDVDEYACQITKSSSRYITWATKKIAFIDAKEWLGPGTSLREFLKCFGEDDDQKLFFPYELVDSVRALEGPFPVYEKWFSSLHNENVLDEHISEEHGRANWQNMKDKFDRENCKNLGDWLHIYQQYDVKPFHKAVVKLIDLYDSEFKIDLFNYFTLPGIAFDYAIRNTSNAFYCIPDTLKEWYYTLQKSITGGFAGCLTQPRVEAGVTRILPNIYGEKAKFVKSINCLDFNSLYPFIMSQELPCGMPRLRHYPRFTLQTETTSLQNSAEGIQFARWLAFDRNIPHLSHAGNGNEVRINGRYPVDAFDPLTGTAYDYHGCWYHYCPECHPLEFLDEKYVQLARDAHARDAEKEQFMLDNNIKYEVTWTCEFKREQKQRPTRWAQFKSSSPDNELENCTLRFPTCFPDDHPIDKDFILEKVESGEFFGFLQVDVHIKPEYRHLYEMYPIIIARKTIKPENLSEHQQHLAAKIPQGDKPVSAVIGCTSATKLMTTSNHVKFWLSLKENDNTPHVEITHIHQICEYDAKKVLADTIATLTDFRRQGDTDPNKKMLAKTAKLTMNSIYGRSLLRKDLFTKTVVCRADDLEYLKKQPQYKSATPLLSAVEVVKRMGDQEPLFLDDGLDPNRLFQVQLAHTHVLADTPIHLGAYILNEAKLHNMRAVYLIKRLAVKGSVNVSYTDTDSLFCCLSEMSVDDCIDESHREEWFRTIRHQWFVREHCDRHFEAYVDAKTNNREWKMEECCRKAHTYYTREPGLLKVEYLAKKLCALNAKTYFLEGMDEDQAPKMSHKGVQRQAAADFTFDTFCRVQDQGVAVTVENRGFRVKGSTLFTYTQKKRGLNPLDKKRSFDSETGMTTYVDTTDN